ncbi:hypothetical protein Krac_5321 [Ktedonobacter racemifer DSM 44963]|uniref:DUF3592 domain-containing protein n=2 Tax=Ktedonobacter racemifer TaxID=363277 RepID=D6TVR2_KTERA|nr:hypothetical protein Krac_5321 [Ktedonobacter racemifer DSM 44963]
MSYPPGILIFLSQNCLYAIPPLFILTGLIMAVKQMWFGRHSVATEGDVIDLRWRMGGKGGGVYYPVVRFQYVDMERGEEEIIFVSRYGSRPPSHKVGDHVPVLYDPAYPANAHINTFGARWLLPCICIFFGGVAALLVWTPMFSLFSH